MKMKENFNENENSMMKMYTENKSKLGFDKTYFSKLLKVAQGTRTSKEFVAQADIPYYKYSDYIFEYVEVPPTTDMLQKIANVAYNKVTYDELAYAAAGVKFSGRNVELVYDEDEVSRIFAREFKKSGAKNIIDFCKTNDINSTTFSAVAGKYTHIDVKLINKFTKGNLRLRHELYNAAGIPTIKNTITGKLTPVKQVKLTKLCLELIKKYSSKKELAEACHISEEQFDDIATGKYDFRPNFDVVDKICRFGYDKNDDTSGEFYLAAGYIYHENTDWKEVSQEKVNSAKNNSEELKGLIIRMMGNRNMQEFAKDANVSSATVSNLINGRYMPRKMSMLRMLAASADKDITFDMLKKAGGINEGTHAKVVLPNEAARERYISYFNTILEEADMDILHFSKACGFSRATGQQVFLGNPRRPSDKTIRKISVNSRHTFEEIRDEVNKYYGIESEK